MRVDYSYDSFLQLLQRQRPGRELASGLPPVRPLVRADPRLPRRRLPKERAPQGPLQPAGARRELLRGRRRPLQLPLRTQAERADERHLPAGPDLVHGLHAALQARRMRRASGAEEWIHHKGVMIAREKDKR